MWREKNPNNWRTRKEKKKRGKEVVRGAEIQSVAGKVSKHFERWPQIFPFIPLNNKVEFYFLNTKREEVSVSYFACLVLHILVVKFLEAVVKWAWNWRGMDGRIGDSSFRRQRPHQDEACPLKGLRSSYRSSVVNESD